MFPLSRSFLLASLPGLFLILYLLLFFSLLLFIRWILVQSNSVTPWTAVWQAPLSYMISWSLLKFMSIESVMPSNHLILCCPLSSCPKSHPASGSFQMSWLFASGRQSIGASTSTSVLPMNIQGWFPLGWTGLISLQSKGPSRVFYSTTIQKHQFFCTQPSLFLNSHMHTWLLEKP